MSIKAYISIVFVFLLTGLAFFNETALADEKAKIVFISGKPSHGPMAHEHRAGNMILADALNRSGLDVQTVHVPHPGYPEDDSILDGAATVVIFCTGHQGHVLNVPPADADSASPEPTTTSIGRMKIFRKVVLNAIFWTANVDVPEDGCPSANVSDSQIKDNLDVKNPGKKNTAKAEK